MAATIKRLQVISSFVILLLFGIPIWWKTTETYRAALPFHQVDQLALEEFTRNPWKIEIEVVISSSNHFNSSQIQTLKQTLHHCLLDAEAKRSSSLAYRHHWELTMRTGNSDVSELLLSQPSMVRVTEIVDGDDWFSELGSSRNGKYQFLVLAGRNTSNRSYTGVILGTKRRGWIAVPSENLEEVLHGSALNQIANTVVSNFLPNSFSYTVGAMPSTKSFQAVTVTPAVRYTLCFTLLNANPNTTHINWNFKAALDTYLQPFLSTINPLAHFTVISQIQHYGKLLKSPIWNKSSSVYLIPEQELPLFINPHQWALDLTDTSTAEPVVNLILYVPDKSHSPLFIPDGGKINRASSMKNAIVAPQWGGIVIYNLTDTDIASNQLDLQPVMPLFLGQIRQLFGLSPIPSNQVSPNAQTGIALWELDVVTRSYLFSNIKSTISTLQSMSNLVQNLSNMMVGDNIANLASESLHSLEQIKEDIALGEYDIALKHSKEAVEQAEEAFFDPSMLALLYFPDEHKLAIYALPFLPILFQVTSGVWTEFKSRR